MNVMQKSFFIATVISCCMSTSAALSSTFTDWTSVDTGNNFAVGTIGATSVTFSGFDIDQGVTDGSSTVFNNPMYTPPLSQSDFIGFKASPDVYQYVLAFSTPIRDPVMHLSSLASVLIFSTSNITKLSGDPLFEVAGNVVSGVINDNPIGYDTNGTIIFSGVFDTISFSANYPNPPLEPTDGIVMQIGGDPVPIPAAVWLFGSALAGLFGFARRKR